MKYLLSRDFSSAASGAAGSSDGASSHSLPYPQFRILSPLPPHCARLVSPVRIRLPQLRKSIAPPLLHTAMIELARNAFLAPSSPTRGLAE